MFLDAYKKAAMVILKKPLVLWGLSLMYVLLIYLAAIFTGIIPVVYMIISYVLSVGMTKVYLDGLKGKEVSSEQLFEGFSDKWGRIAGALAWRDLWILIWALVPVAGPIIAIIKAYEYRFVPYIVATRPEVKATEALKLSMKETEGKKGQMFLADFLLGFIIFAAYLAIFIVMAIFGAIPYIGGLFIAVFGLVIILLTIAILAFYSIFTGLYQASFYDDGEAVAEVVVEEVPAIEETVEVTE